MFKQADVVYLAELSSETLESVLNGLFDVSKIVYLGIMT